MSYHAIWDALDTLAGTLEVVGDIANEGDTYVPIEGRPYCLTKLAAYNRTATGPGADCVMLEQGSYVMSLRRPADEGRGAASDISDQVIALFARGTYVTTATNQVVSILVASAQPIIADGAWLTLPIAVSFYADDSTTQSGTISGTGTISSGTPITLASEATTDVVASGTTQATATPLTIGINLVLESSGPSSGVIVGSATSAIYSISNQTMNSILVYPPVGAQIDTLGVNTPASLGAGAAVSIQIEGATQCYTVSS